MKNPFRKNFKDVVCEMKSFGEFLVSYNFPKTHISNEEDLYVFKNRELYVDGYSLTIYFNKSDWERHYVETVQTAAKYFPFLPFSLVCKIGRAFLGDECLALTEVIRDNHRIYCWTLIRDKKGKPRPNPYSEDDVRIYEGLEYNYLDSKEVSFY